MLVRSARLWLIPQINMMDLSDLDTRNSDNVLLDLMLGSTLPSSYPVGQCWQNLVRLTDKATRTYEAARNELMDWSPGEGETSKLFRGMDYLDDCVLATFRGGRHAKELLLQAGKSKEKWKVPPWAVTRKQSKDLTAARDAIMHTDDRLSNDSRRLRNHRPIQAGDIPQLVPLQHRLQIGEVRLSYRDLASCIRKLHAVVWQVRQTGAA